MYDVYPYDLFHDKEKVGMTYNLLCMILSYFLAPIVI
jgi:hypothetical protein